MICPKNTTRMNVPMIMQRHRLWSATVRPAPYDDKTTATQIRGDIRTTMMEAFPIQKPMTILCWITITTNSVSNWTTNIIHTTMIRISTTMNKTHHTGTMTIRAATVIRRVCSRKMRCHRIRTLTTNRLRNCIRQSRRSWESHARCRHSVDASIVRAIISIANMKR